MVRLIAIANLFLLLMMENSICLLFNFGSKPVHVDGDVTDPGVNRVTLPVSGLRTVVTLRPLARRVAPRPHPLCRFEDGEHACLDVFTNTHNAIGIDGRFNLSLRDQAFARFPAPTPCRKSLSQGVSCPGDLLFQSRRNFTAVS